ncbi:MAG: O-antigen ligase family protein [Verrucomicrobiales bacterium]|nr:O-antigen ligase family protein [Verrucomicrobiales bacterium]
MEFFLSVFFLLFYYLRPQDWVPGLTGANLIKPIIAIWLLTLLVNRSRPAALNGLLRTPHDWAMLAYFAYIVITAPDFMAAFTGFLPFVAFYALTVQSVNTWPRLLSYLKWWNMALVFVALLAVMSLFGLDLTGAKEPTARFADRLSLGTWLHDNPNALGHSVITVIPLAYFLFFWKGSAAGRFVVFPLLAALAYYCVLRTESKGSFLVGGILVAAVFVVGRPRIVQILATVTALTLGIGALSFLPRMADMNNLRADEGVQGRLLAWEQARNVTRKTETGEGWQQFIALIDWKEGNRMIYDIPKSTHSSYVQVGADLGQYGLFLYLAALWCALHTLLVFKPTSEMEDRCRRVLLVLLIGNVISGWMINRQYHTEYFLIIAATASLHRLRKAAEIAEEEAKSLLEDESEEGDEVKEQEEKPPSATAVPAFARETSPLDTIKPLWNRFGMVDLVVSIGLTWLTFWTWDYILENI